MKGYDKRPDVARLDVSAVLTSPWATLKNHLVGSTRSLAKGDIAAPHRRFAGLARRPLAGGLTVVVASGRSARGRGLARLDEAGLPSDHALLLERCRSVHTLGMRFALDLLWLDEDGAPLRLDRAVAPRRLRGCRRAAAVIECRAGHGDRFAAGLRAADD